MATAFDFTYPSGERWLEVSPAEGSADFCLVLSRPEKPVGIETGVPTQVRLHDPDGNSFLIVAAR